MYSTMFDKALGYLYKQLKDTRIALGHAEDRPGVKQEELDNLRGRIELIEWLTGVVLAYEEPKHGEWVKVYPWKDNPQTTLQCSACKRCQPVFEHDETEFCPYCGAKMDGGKDHV